MKLIVTQIQRSINGLKRFKIDVNLFFLSFFGNNGTAVNHETIGRNLNYKRNFNVRIYLIFVRFIMRIIVYIPFVYNFNLCCVEVIAANTDKRLTRDLMLDAVPYSSANIVSIR